MTTPFGMCCWLRLNGCAAEWAHLGTDGFELIHDPRELNPDLPIVVCAGSTTKRTHVGGA